MRNRLIILGIMALVCLAYVGPAEAAPTVFVDGRQLAFEVRPIIENGRTLVPLRTIFEALGAHVGWEASTRTVRADKSGTEIKLVVGQTTAYKNGSAVKLDVPSKIVGGRTFVPLRFVSEALGAQVQWNGLNDEITIQSSQQSWLQVEPNNVFTLTTVADFSRGSLEKLAVTQEIGGEVQLLEVNDTYTNRGVFTSDIIHTAPFSNLIASWNSDTPSGTVIGIEAQVLVNEQWSDWISWGTWSTNKERSSVNDDKSTNLAGIWTDTLYVKDGKKANAFRLRAILSSTELHRTPILRSVSATIDLGSGAMRLYPSDENSAAIENVERKLNVPAFSQYMRDPQIADSICSPTSATCVINYYLDKYEQSRILPEESAYAVYDSVYDGFGNWSFGASYMGSFGLNSRVEFCESLYDLKREIYQGRPVVVSINYARNENSTDPKAANYPLLHGFPIETTRGHLITVTGFTKINGNEYVCVNDSAAASDSAAKRKYLADEFDAAWATSGRVAYTANDLDGVAYNPLHRLTSVLYGTMNLAQNGFGEYAEFQLVYNGNKIDLSNANTKIIMVSRDGESFEYIIPDARTNLWLPKNVPTGKYYLIFIAKNDKEYAATITI